MKTPILFMSGVDYLTRRVKREILPSCWPSSVNLIFPEIQSIFNDTLLSSPYKLCGCVSFSYMIRHNMGVRVVKRLIF